MNVDNEKGKAFKSIDRAELYLGGGREEGGVPPPPTPLDP